MFLFWKSSCSEWATLQKRRYSELLLFWRQISSETVAVLKKCLSSRSSWLEKVLLARSTYKKEVAAPDN